MDEGFTERLVYSDSDENDDAESHLEKDLNDSKKSDATPEKGNNSKENVDSIKCATTDADECSSADENVNINSDLVEGSSNDIEDDDVVIKTARRAIATTKIISSDEESDFDDDSRKGPALHYTDSENEEGKQNNGDKETAKTNSSDSDEIAAPKTNKKSGKSSKRPAIWDSDESEADKNENNQPKLQSSRPNIWDSDSNNSAPSATEGKKKIKKMKNKKVLNKIKEQSRKKANQSGSDCNTSGGSRSSDDDENGANASRRLKTLCDEESTASSNSDGSDRESHKQHSPVDVQKREKPAQRMSAKVAEDQMKEIQSESQRLARDIYINVPYHKPKQYSFKEFMSRRCIAKSSGSTAPAFQKAAAAIKMSEMDLALYANSLEKRAEEAIEFFQNENDDSKTSKTIEETNEKCNPIADASENDVDTAIIGDDFESILTSIDQSHSLDTSEALVHQSQSEKMDTSADDILAEDNFPNVDKDAGISTSQHNENSAILPSNSTDEAKSSEPFNSSAGSVTASTLISDTPAAGISKPVPSTSDHPTPICSENIPRFTDFHTKKTQLDLEIDSIALPGEKKQSLLSAEYAPRLKGKQGMVIDLETNELKEKEKTGVDELFERFLKHSGKCLTKKEPEEISIFNSDNLVLETHKLNSTNTGAKTKEPKPGEAYFKLKDELSKKIFERRKEIISKRLQEEQKLKEEESDYGESEEEIDEDKINDDTIDEKKVDECNETDEKPKDVASGCESDEGPLSEDEDEESLQMYEDTENDSDANGENELESEKEVEPVKKSRILAAFQDDSDEEIDDAAKEKVQKADTNSVHNTSALDGLSTQISGQLGEDFTQMTPKISNSNVDDFMASIFETKAPSPDCTLNDSPAPPMNLYSQASDEADFPESQLEALCSGTFMTQHPSAPIQTDVEPSQTDGIDQIRKGLEKKSNVEDCDHLLLSKDEAQATLMSSDSEEEGSSTRNAKKQKKTKKKVKPLGFSDDEDNSNDMFADNNSEQLTDDEEEDEEAEKFVEYDSEENEVEVTMCRKDVKRKASEFFENEAELSESEWGSADEDEKDLDKFEMELGDEDEFDKEKLHSELERIRLRQQIDQDAREVKMIKEMLFEEEEDKGERDRKFRWKHLDNTDNINEIQPSGDGEDNAAHESDEDNEEEWRRLRFEREQMLKEQMVTNQSSETFPASQDRDEPTNNSTTSTNVSSIFRRTSIIKSASNSPQLSSSFLINKSDFLMQKGRKSFLSRDNKTLEKLVNLTKNSGDGETVATTANTKGSYLFTTTEKPNVLKRRSDNVVVEDSPNNNNSKKPKLSAKPTIAKGASKCIFELMN